MRAWLTLALLLTLALAGCSSGGGDGDDDETSTTTTTSSTRTTTSRSSTTSSTSTSSGPQNEAPTGSITATVNGTKVVFNLTGNDSDGDELSWTLSFGDGNSTEGSDLPASLNHTFAPGNYTAHYNLTDGAQTVGYNLTLNLTAGGGAKQIFEGSWTAPATGCGGPYDDWVFGTPAADVGWAEVAIDAATIGKPYKAVFTVEQAAPVTSFVSISFYSSAEPPAPPETSLLDGGGAAFTPALEITGTVPAQAAFALFMTCLAGPATVHYEA